MSVNKKAQAHARKLVDEARSGFLTADKAIMEIIRIQAWNALGYRDFTDLFDKEFADVYLAGAARSYVVYEMFNAGRSVEEVADSVPGLGPETAESLKRQKDNGVPADKVVRESNAKTTVREHDRLLPENRFLPEVGPLNEDNLKELMKWRRSARSLGMTWSEFVLAAIRAYERLG
jgi:hypothetical protein